jgi:hypothetical protein
LVQLLPESVVHLLTPAPAAAVAVDAWLRAHIFLTLITLYNAAFWSWHLKLY